MTQLTLPPGVDANQLLQALIAQQGANAARGIVTPQPVPGPTIPGVNMYPNLTPNYNNNQQQTQAQPAKPEVVLPTHDEPLPESEVVQAEQKPSGKMGELAQLMALFTGQTAEEKATKRAIAEETYRQCGSAGYAEIDGL